jgi:diamine N-acetyltransferase
MAFINPVTAHFIRNTIKKYNPVMIVIKLRTLKTADLANIQNWPPYPPEFADLDYALRGNGWLAELQGRTDTWLYIAEQEHDAVGFSILTKTGQLEAEFRIALRADKIGLGIGKTITLMTMNEGFSRIGLSSIHLIARKNNPRAIGLYKRVGFSVCGECLKNIDDKPVSIIEMTISGPVWRVMVNC